VFRIDLCFPGFFSDSRGMGIAGSAITVVCVSGVCDAMRLVRAPWAFHRCYETRDIIESERM
jgi:hypothetical protein